MCTGYNNVYASSLEMTGMPHEKIPTMQLEIESEMIDIRDKSERRMRKPITEMDKVTKVSKESGRQRRYK